MGDHLGIFATKQRLRNLAAAAVSIIWILQSPPTMAQVDSHAVSANDLVRAAINHELQQSTADRSRWTYEAETNEGSQQRTKRVVETPNGSVERLIAVNGQELSTKEELAETKRIEEFVNSSQEQEKANRTQQKDAAQCVELLKMLPEAFLFSYGEQQGDLTRLMFKPNPKFQPSSWQSRVLHAMEGEVLVSTNELRLAAIHGRLTEDVKFGAGLIGHLKSGGTFQIERQNIGYGHWEMTTLQVNMTGKALVFKTLSVQHKETKTSFERVRDNLTARDAAGELNLTPVLAKNQ